MHLNGLRIRLAKLQREFFSRWQRFVSNWPARQTGTKKHDRTILGLRVSASSAAQRCSLTLPNLTCGQYMLLLCSSWQSLAKKKHRLPRRRCCSISFSFSPDTQGQKMRWVCGLREGERACVRACLPGPPPSNTFAAARCYVRRERQQQQT